MPYYLGADVGATKTHVVVIDHLGHVAGVGRSGPGNPEEVGPDGLHAALALALEQALQPLGLAPRDLAGAGLGIAGYDWPEDLPPILAAVSWLGLDCPTRIVNDAVPGLVIGARDGWGISIVAGTGCNCYGRTRDGAREGRVTGHGSLMGEHAGAGELVRRAMQLVSYAWTRRGEPTALTDAFAAHVGATDEADLLAGYSRGRYRIGAEAAPIVFRAADDGDQVAHGLIDWAGTELGEMINAVARQLHLHTEQFDVVMNGGMFAGGQRLIDSLQRTVTSVTANASLVHLTAPPALGAALLGMEQAGDKPTAEVREALTATPPSP